MPTALEWAEEVAENAPMAVCRASLLALVEVAVAASGAPQSSNGAAWTSLATVSISVWRQLMCNVAVAQLAQEPPKKQITQILVFNKYQRNV